jgi:hypothetical protein
MDYETVEPDREVIGNFNAVQWSSYARVVQDAAYMVCEGYSR